MRSGMHYTRPIQASTTLLLPSTLLRVLNTRPETATSSLLADLKQHKGLGKYSMNDAYRNYFSEKRTLEKVLSNSTQ